MRTAVAALLAGALAGCAGAAPAAPAAGGAGFGDRGRVAAVASSRPGEPDDSRGAGTLAAVRERGRLRCGLDDSGFWSARGHGGGFSYDLCRAIAAAVLGDAGAVDRVAVGDGVAALSTGDADVFVAGLAWTASREGAGQVAFTTPVFFDGDGVMVRADGITDLGGLADAVVCAAEGTLSFRAVARLDALGARIVTFPDASRVEAAVVARACDAWVDRISRLAVFRGQFDEGPGALAILDEPLTLDPLAPTVANDDPAWRDAVGWALHATFLAEEHGVDAAGVADRAGTGDPDVRRLMGLTTREHDGDRPARFNPGLGLPAGFPARVVGQVGNYGEIHARHLGRLGIPRGPTALWRDGGLVRPPPYR